MEAIYMSEETIDHVARAEINVLRSEMTWMKDAVERQGRRSELFETETRSNFDSIKQKIDDGFEKLADKITASTSRVHTRFDTFVKWALTSLITLFVTGGAGILWFLVQKVLGE